VRSKDRVVLSKYRIEKARESIADAKVLFENSSYRSSNNRAYYAIFDTMRAVLALEGSDYKKHSGLIQHFQKEYIKTGVFPKELSKTITSASIIRNASDYEDFYIATKAEAQIQLDASADFINTVVEYLTPIWEK
jgi:uncharacterized protein (UPF0332 family)